jgi:hypothetical protein
VAVARQNAKCAAERNQAYSAQSGAETPEIVVAPARLIVAFSEARKASDMR